MTVSFGPSVGSAPSMNDMAVAAVLTQPDKPWTPRSFFDPPRVNAPAIVEFGQGKTYDFFA